MHDQLIGMSRRIFHLKALVTAQIIDDMNIPGFRLHTLKGEDEGSLVDLGQWKLATYVRIPGLVRREIGGGDGCCVASGRRRVSADRDQDAGALGQSKLIDVTVVVGGEQEHPGLIER